MNHLCWLGLAVVIVAGCSGGDEKQREIDALKARLAASERKQVNQTPPPAPAPPPPAVDNQAQLDASADEEETARAAKIKHHFPELPNAMEDCVAKKGGAHAREMSFGTASSLAYKIQLGGDHVASRFLDYFRKAFSCTAFSSHDERLFLPLIPYIQNTKQLGVAIAIVGDATAAAADTSDEAVSGGVQALVDNFEKSGSYDGKRHR